MTSIVELEIANDISEEEWRELGAKLGETYLSSQWWIGDWMLFGELAFCEPGEIVDVALTITGLSRGRLYNIKSCCRRVAPDRRREDLSFEHHAEVAALDPHGQTEWLKRAAENDWSKDALRRAISTGGRPLGDLTARRRLAEAARLVCLSAQPRRSGGFAVPREDLELLAEAIGARLPELEGTLLSQVRRIVGGP